MNFWKDKTEPLLQKEIKLLSIAIYVYAGSITIEYGIRHRVLLACNKGDSLFADWDMPNSSHI